MIFPVRYAICAIFLLLSTLPAADIFSQPTVASHEALFTTPRTYTALFSAKAPVIDGKLDDDAWNQAAWTETFVDIEGSAKPAPTWQTRAKMTWTEEGVYIGAEMVEPHIWAYLKEHDEIVFYDNDFEVFIDPDNDTHRYFEIEVNALNTIFDLFMSKPYRNGSGALIPYDTPGLKSAVYIDGTLNDPSDVDKGWSVEMFIPFRAVTIGNIAKAPLDGEFWRIGFSRVEWDVEVIEGKYVKKKGANGRNLPEHNWVWSPQGLINMHYPERWGYLFFSRPESGQAPKSYEIPYSERQKEHLWRIYYLQKDHFQKNRTYARDFKALGVAAEKVTVDGKVNSLRMEATSRQFAIYIQDGAIEYSVNDEGLVQVIRQPQGRQL